MKQRILFLVCIVNIAQGAASSYNHLPAALPRSIKIYGERGTITEKIHLESEDPLTLMPYEQHIEDMAKRQLPWILAAFWWQDQDGSLARDYADAISLNQWRLNEKYDIKKHLHPSNQQPIVCVEYFLFDIINKKLSIERLGTEQQLSNDVLLQNIFKVLENPEIKKGKLRTKLFEIAKQYQKHNDQTHALIWFTKSALLGSFRSAQKLVRWYCDNEEYEKALHVWQKFARSNDRCSRERKYYGIGHIYEEQENYTQAIINYAKSFQTTTPSLTDYQLISALSILYINARHQHAGNIIDNDLLLTCAHATLSNKHSVSNKNSYYKTAIRMAKKLVNQQ